MFDLQRTSPERCVPAWKKSLLAVFLCFNFVLFVFAVIAKGFVVCLSVDLVKRVFLLMSKKQNIKLVKQNTVLN